MNKDITEFPNLKQIEQILWNKLQEIFSKALKSLLEDMDQQIAEERDKKRFRQLDRRKLQIASLFDEIEVKRNYCRDRKTGEYVHLLDRYLKFEGTGQPVDGGSGHRISHSRPCLSKSGPYVGNASRLSGYQP
nr:hypothetical protein [Bacillaceae bacterium]